MDRHNKLYVAFDTETTGLLLPRKQFNDWESYTHWCYPYLATFVWGSEAKDWFSVEFDVDPKTRIPIWEPRKVNKIKDLLKNKDIIFVGHNVKFDIRALSVIPGLEMTEKFWLDLIEERCDDTMLMWHILDSQRGLELKPLAYSAIDYPDQDESDLKEQVDECRKRAPEGFTIANTITCPWQQKAPKRGWYILDTWLPRAMDPNAENLAEKYCYHDSCRTYCLHARALPAIAENRWMEQYERNRLALVSTFRMETYGVSVRDDLIDQKNERIESAVQLLTEKSQKYAAKVKPVKSSYAGQRFLVSPIDREFNPGSDAQVRKILYDYHNLPVKKRTDSGLPSTDIDSLISLLDTTKGSQVFDFIKDLLVLSKFSTTSNYLTSYTHKIALSRLFSSYNVCGTATTRMSSSDPNGQNIGKGEIKAGMEFLFDLMEEWELDLSLRSVFAPLPGWEWYSVDYHQLQLVIFAIMSGDPKMIDAVNKGHDFHDFVGRQVYGLPEAATLSKSQRRVAKACNFGYIFGAGDHKLNTVSDIPNLSKLLRTLFPYADRKIKAMVKQVKESSTVFTAGGYPLHVPEDTAYAGVCYEVQGSEGELVKKATYDSDKYLKKYTPESFITLNVHDELVFAFRKGQGRKHMRNIKDIMEQAGEFFGFPTKVNIEYIEPGKSWANGVKVAI